MKIVLPADEATYAIVVKASTKTSDVLTYINSLTRMDADHVILFSQAPHDVEARNDWHLIADVGNGTFRRFSTVILTEQQITDYEKGESNVVVLAPFLEQRG